MKRLCVFLAGLVLVGISFAQAQTVRITGTVTSSEDGAPVPGVSVIVKGTTLGSSTDIDGKYTLNVSVGTETLVFSFVGLKTQEIAVSGRQIIDVIMEPDSKELDEVVVVGYGTRLKSELTGSVSQVKSEDIANVTQPSFESAIQGKTAGVYVQGGSGKLGQGIKIRVRGAASVSASNQPLYIVDNIPVNTDNIGSSGNEPTNPMADLNPADIESIQVLKDASAAAIYGARAANGVVLITTKRGKEGKTNFNFTSQVGFSEPANKVGFLNRNQYLQLVEEGFNNVRAMYGDNAYSWLGVGATDSWDVGLDNLFNYWRDPNNPNDLTKGPDTNWEDQAFRRGTLQQYDLSASGGNNKTTFYASLSWANQEGIIINNDFDRISARLNIDQRSSDRVSFGFNLNPVRSRSFRVANDNAFASPLQMVALPPLDPIYLPGSDVLNTRTSYENGLIPAKYNSFNTTTYRNIGNVYASFVLLEGLSFRSEVGADLTNQHEEGYQGRLTNDGGPAGSASDRNVTLLNYTLNNFFSYDRVFAERFDVNLVGGMSYQQSDYNESSAYGLNFPSDHFRKINSAAEIEGAYSSATNYSFLSYFFRSNIKLYDKYLFTLSARADGSSRFGKNNRYGFFPAASAAWILSKEEFLSNVEAISFLKLRASWGVTGNAEIGNFDSRGLYSASNYAGYSGVIPVSLPSEDLKWETTKQVDVGIDFGFFNNRITGEIDYYVKNTSDLLLNVSVPGTSGYSFITKNVGKLSNKGWEFVINGAILTGRLKWNASFNISSNENEITDLDGQIIRSGIWRAMEGQPLGVFFMPKYAGVDPQNGDALFYKDESRTETTNSLSEAEHQVVGNPNPKFIGGLSNNLSYKGFDFSFMLQFVTGNDIYNGGRQWQADGLSWLDNQTEEYFENRWQKPGDDAKYPQARWLEGNGYGVSSMLVFDGSYLRLKDVTLGYTLPKRLLENYGIATVRIFAKGLNIWTLTNYPGWDPEANFVGAGPTVQSQNMQQGYDFYTAPQPRSITFGVQLGF
ncbi:MAG: TonB-dependent receptor [Bacteroidales bacterium]|nr:TonB-dependent receptor [Bacteroidales bacterium]MBN2749533.1 TonB-dependent receptor [Bacteroidales bacterium]